MHEEHGVAGHLAGRLGQVELGEEGGRRDGYASMQGGDAALRPGRFGRFGQISAFAAIRTHCTRGARRGF